MITNRVASLDGYGDRDDIALENDRMYNERPPEPFTRWEDYHAQQKHHEEFDTYNPKGMSLSELIKSKVWKGESGSILQAKQLVNRDFEDLESLKDDILLEARVPDGWEYPLVDSEQLNLIDFSKSGEVEILIQMQECP